MSEWFTIEGATPEQAAAAQERVLHAWADAPLTNLEVCGFILDVAREQVIAYAPKSTVPEEQIAALLLGLGYVDEAIAAALLTLELDPPALGVPSRYVYAQLQQAINLYNAGNVSSDGNIGDGGYSFTPRPLDKTIRGIIRPVDGKPDAY